MGRADKPRSRSCSLRRKFLLGGLVALFVLALALGLGLGLTVGRGDDDDDDNSPPTSTLSPLPTPDGTPTWIPKVNDTWQIILSHPPVLSSPDTTTPDVSIFDIDLFDTPAETIRQLHILGKKVICYFSAGSYEQWRPDAGQFQPADLGKELDGWPGEKWLKVNSENVRKIMKSRIDMAKKKGCDGVDPDNVDGYQNDNGLGLTQQDSISYMTYLSSLTVPLNLTLGLKNAGGIISAVLPIVHFSVNEQCVQYGECSTFSPFIKAGKPVFHIEYPQGAGEGEVETQGLKEDEVKKFCGREGKAEGSEGFSTVLKKMKLDGWVEYCDKSVQVTSVNETAGGNGQR
ncbi:glycoside hydrolase superfamily [Pyrenochaeta sp. MPI-SDFR-AT-0127]|nr:glycoside hydrolase superfamily [Pyrenochaeta sp. MPI-SDFR-AT-0127]